MYQGIIHDTSNDVNKRNAAALANMMRSMGKKASSLSDCSLSSSSSSSSSILTPHRYFKQKEDSTNEELRHRMLKNANRGDGETDDDHEYDPEESYDPYEEHTSELNTSSKYLNINTLVAPKSACKKKLKRPINSIRRYIPAFNAISLFIEFPLWRT